MQLNTVLSDLGFLGRCIRIGLIDPWLARCMLDVGPVLGTGALATARAESGPAPVPVRTEDQLRHDTGGSTFVVFYAVPDENPYEAKESESQCVEWDAVEVVATDREEACSKVRAVFRDRPLRPILVLTRAQAAWFCFRVAAVDEGLVRPTPPH